MVARPRTLPSRLSAKLGNRLGRSLPVAMRLRRPTRRPQSGGTDDLPLTRRMLGVDLDGSRRIWPAHGGWPVGPDGSQRMQKDRLDDQRMIKGLPMQNRMARLADLQAAPTTTSSLGCRLNTPAALVVRVVGSV